ncbi:MAG: DNA repair protein RecO [Bacillota bacterium]
MKTLVSTGITVSSVDYQEKDKIVTVFMLSGEKISMRARGINAPKAKLKFASELFSLCEFEYSDSKNPLLITATPKHMFWGIRESVEKLYLACFVLENLAESEGDAKFLLACLSFLEVNEYSTKMAVKYIFEVIKHQGFGFSVKSCVKCGNKLSGLFAFDFDKGGFLCENCGGNEKTSLLKTLQFIADMDIEQLSKIKFSKQQEIEMLKLLEEHFGASAGKGSGNLRELVKIAESPLLW